MVMIGALRVNAPRGNNKVPASNRCRVVFVSSADTSAGFDWGWGETRGGEKNMIIIKRQVREHQKGSQSNQAKLFM